MAEDPDWRKYEKQIAEDLRVLGGTGSTVEFDQKMPGRYSRVDRQVDALVTGGYAGQIEQGVTAAVDCKFYKGNVDVKGVETFQGLLDDVGTDMGFMVTTHGYSPAARNRAQHGGRSVKLRVMAARILIFNPDDPPYVPSYDEAYYSGDFWEGGPGPNAPTGARIAYQYVDDPGYTLESVNDLEWMEDVLASDTTDVLNWSSGPERENCARIILRHYLGDDPSDEDVESFLGEFEPEFEDGQLWAIYVGEIREKTGLWSKIQQPGPDADLYDLDEDEH